MNVVRYALVALGGIALMCGAAGLFVLLLSLWFDLWWGVNPAWLGGIGYFSPIIIALFGVIGAGAIGIYRESRHE